MANLLTAQAAKIGKFKVLSWHVFVLCIALLIGIVALRDSGKLQGLFSSASDSGPMRAYRDLNGKMVGVPVKVTNVPKGQLKILSANFRYDPWTRQNEFSDQTELFDLATTKGYMYALGNSLLRGYVGISYDDGRNWQQLGGFNDSDDHWSGLVTPPDGRVGVYGVSFSGDTHAYQRMVRWSTDGINFGDPVLVGPPTFNWVITSGMVFSDSNHGYAYDLYSGGVAQVFYTQTGGKTNDQWIESSTNAEPGQFFGNQGSALKSGRYFLPGTKNCTTLNFGIKWECTPALMNDSDLSANFSDDKNGWVAGGYAVLDENGTWVSAQGWAFRTTDGGATWSNNLTPGLNWNVQQIFHPAFNTAETWLVGGFPRDLRIGGIIKTTDNGLTWQQELSSDRALYRCINKSKVVYCIGYNGNDQRTTLYRRQ